VIISTLSLGTLSSLTFLLAITLHQGNSDRKYQSEILFCQIKDIFSIFRWYLNGATYKWKIHNEKFEITSFRIECRSQLTLTVQLRDVDHCI
jgi:hypothetical protein